MNGFCKTTLTSAITVLISLSMNIAANAVGMTLTPAALIAAEDAYGNKMIWVSLDSPSPTPVTLNISGYVTGKVTGDATVTIPAGQTMKMFYLRTLDGPASPILTISDPAAVYPTAWMSISVTNLPPNIITPNVDSSYPESGIKRTL